MIQGIAGAEDSAGSACHASKVEWFDVMNWSNTCLAAIAMQMIGVFVAILTFVAPCAYAEEAPVAQYDLVYGTAEGVSLKLDLFSPAGTAGTLPGLVLIHGGGWVAGSKQEFRTFALEMTKQHGFVCVSIDYRFAPRFRFPAQVEDAKCAVRWLRANAERLRVDPQRIGAIGKSAGGYLAMMLGVLNPQDGWEGSGGQPDESSKVEAVVSISGPTTFIADQPPIRGHLVVANFLGGNMYDHRELFQQASPISHVDAGDSPILLLHGTRDSLVPVDHATQMAEALTTAGVSGRVELLIGSGHNHRGPVRDHTLRAAAEFLKSQLQSDQN